MKAEYCRISNRGVNIEQVQVLQDLKRKRAKKKKTDGFRIKVQN